MNNNEFNQFSEQDAKTEKHRRIVTIISLVLIVLASLIVISTVIISSVNRGSQNNSQSEDEVSSVYELSKPVDESNDISDVISSDEISDTDAFSNESSVTEQSGGITSEEPDGEQNENEIKHGWVINEYGYTYVYGDTGYLQFNYKNSAFNRYVNALNSLADSIDDEVNIYNIIAPVSTTFADIPREIYTADDFYNLGQSKFVSNVGKNLNERIINIPIVDILETAYDNGEYVFFRTDKNWTSAAAYKAYAAFCAASGTTAYSSASFPKLEIPNFLGSFYDATKSEEMLNNPDTIVCYSTLPSVNAALTIYDDKSVFASYTAGKGTFARNYGYNVFLGMSDASLYELKTTAKSSKKLLIIGDSSAAPLSLLLASHYSQIDILDPSSYDGNLKSLLTDHEFDDILTICYSVNAVSGDFVPALSKFSGTVTDDASESVYTNE